MGFRTLQSKTTGRHIVVFRQDAVAAGLERLKSIGLEVRESNTAIDRIDAQGALFFPTLGVAIVAASAEQLGALIAATRESNSSIVSVEPEKIRRALQNQRRHSERSTSNTQEAGSHVREVSQEVLLKAAKARWGLHAAGVFNSSRNGRGVRLAVLDTGLDLKTDGGDFIYHPDFQGRLITAKCFVPSLKTVDDGDGHGTHCTGTACGPLKPKTTPRYGIAWDADIFIGKVLDDDGEGEDGWIIAGIEWAINEKCHIVSLALGWEKEPDAPYSIAYENIAYRALESGTLIMAAAGNDSLRPSRVCPINEPAGCKSILAVGAIDVDLQVATFSNGGVDIYDRAIDIVAPGVDIFSTYLMPKRYATKYGTSMAVSHVAGITALYAEAYPGVVGLELWSILIKGAATLPFPPQDVGAGVAKAPV